MLFRIIRMIHNHLPHRMYVHASPTVHANVAAMIHRHPAPARGWPRWMLRIRKSNEWPYGQWRQIAAATPGTSNSKPNVAAMIHRHPAPARGWPRWMLRIRMFNEWPYGQWRQIAAATVGVPYFGLYHSSPQVICPTWRAANSRPY